MATLRRLRSARNAYLVARSFEVGRLRAGLLAVRMFLTGKTGRYRIKPILG